MVKVALKTGSDVITSGHDIFSADYTPQATMSSRASGRFIPLGAAADVGMLENIFGDSSFMVRKSAFVDVGGFTEDFGIGFEDYEFFAKISIDKRAKLSAIPEALTWYRKPYNGDSMTENTELKENQARMLRPYVAKQQQRSLFSQNVFSYAQKRLFARSDGGSFAVFGTNTTAVFSTTQSPTSFFATSTTTVSPSHTSTTFFATSTTSVTPTPTFTVCPTPGWTKDCAGTCLPPLSSSRKVFDQCNVCGGNGKSCIDCVGTPFGTAKPDICGVCAGDGSSCLDCYKTVHGNAKLDACGVCGGDGSSCGVVFEELYPNIVYWNKPGKVGIVGAGLNSVTGIRIGGNFLPNSRLQKINQAFLWLTLQQGDFSLGDGAQVKTFTVDLVFSGGERSKTISVYQNSAVSKALPDQVLLPGSSQILTVQGDSLFSRSSARCWFNFTQLDWDDDFTGTIYRNFNASTAATYNIDRYECAGPKPFASSLVNVWLSYSGYGMMPIVLSNGFIFYVDQPFAPVADNADMIIEYKSPSPVIEKAYLDNSGAFVVFEFANDVNYNDFDGSDCAALFETNFDNLDSAIYAKIVSNPDFCSFQFSDPKTLQVFTGAEFAKNYSAVVIGPGKKIRFRSGVLKAYNERYATFFTGTLENCLF